MYLIKLFHQHYAVASVSWIEKKVAATLFATPPNSTYEEALESFEKVCV